MSWLFSQVLVAEFLEAKSLDGQPSVPSSLSLSDASGLHSDKTKAFFRPSQSGTEILPLSTEHRGEELLTWFRAASRARTSAQPTPVLKAFPVRVHVSGRKGSESFARFDQDSSSWRTHQCSLEGGWELFSETFPRWGMMRNGECWELTTWEDTTGGIGCSLWQTCVKDDAVNREAGKFNSRGEPKLAAAVQLWPTVISSTGGPNTNSKSVQENGHGNNLAGAVNRWCRPLLGNYNRKGASKNSGNGLATEVQTAFGWMLNTSETPKATSAPLNPDFAEWLMGWPIGWTASQPLETDRFRQWLPPCGIC